MIELLLLEAALCNWEEAQKSKDGFYLRLFYHFCLKQADNCLNVVRTFSLIDELLQGVALFCVKQSALFFHMMTNIQMDIDEGLSNRDVQLFNPFHWGFQLFKCCSFVLTFGGYFFELKWYLLKVQS